MPRDATSDLRSLPSVDALLRRPELAALLAELPRPLVVDAVRDEIAAAREALGVRGRVGTNGAPDLDPAALAARAATRARADHAPMLRRVLNATGIVLHTNLGRTPLSDAARRAVDEVARGYASLEFELATGKRGGRGAGPERWLTRLTGAESALVVNNGAAAILVTLSALAEGKSVIVSRGELVEIGGSFRVPDVMAKSGAKLIEVGTTNRTHLRDYERALEKHRDVAAILRVHRSNFRIEGFTAQPALEDLARLARRQKVALIEDLGSGALVDLEPLGLEREPTVKESLAAGCDVVTFSGDKLLGSTQAGLILGRKRFVDRVRRDPLVRALRVDKLTLAALEATLPAYLDPDRARREIPALAMLSVPADVLERRARRLAESIAAGAPGLTATIAAGAGEVGGGALPLQRLPGPVVALHASDVAAAELEAIARGADPPVIGYVREGRYRLDVRTLFEDDIEAAAQSIARAWNARAANGPGARDQAREPRARDRAGRQRRE
jgi:L-seryl-tRNA(Ser) seleniumtransferase